MIQSTLKRSNSATIIRVPNHLVSIVCVYFIANTSTFLLAGVVFGYMFYQSSNKKDHPKLLTPSSTITLSKSFISLPLSQDEPSIVIPSSLNYDNQVQYASINHSFYNTLNNDMDSSMDFENLLKFPACPARLPELNTQFNFSLDHHHDIQHHEYSTPVDWSAIHKEIEMEEQLLETYPLAFSVLSSSSEESIISLIDDGVINKSDALKHAPAYSNYVSSSFQLDDAIEDILLLQPHILKPSVSSPTQVFKNKVQQAVRRIQPKKMAIKLNEKRKSVHFCTDVVTPKPSVSTQLKGKLNKLFKK